MLKLLFNVFSTKLSLKLDFSLCYNFFMIPLTSVSLYSRGWISTFKKFFPRNWNNFLLLLFAYFNKLKKIEKCKKIIKYLYDCFISSQRRLKDWAKKLFNILLKRLREWSVWVREKSIGKKHSLSGKIYT